MGEFEICVHLGKTVGFESRSLALENIKRSALPSSAYVDAFFYFATDYGGEDSELIKLVDSIVKQ